MKELTKRIFEKENQSENLNSLIKAGRSHVTIYLPNYIFPKGCSFASLITTTQILGNSKSLNQSNSLKTKQDIELKPKIFDSNTYSSRNSKVPIVKVDQKFKQTLEYSSMQTTTQKIMKTLENDDTSFKEADLRKYLSNYSSDLFTFFHNLESPQDYLKNHTITPNLRAKMVDWMIEVLGSYKCSDHTFFIAIRLMDSFLMKSLNMFRQQTPQDLHLLGVTCMFISCKYEEIYPIKLQIFFEKIAHRKLTKEEIKEKEAEICHCLDFCLNGLSILDILVLILSKLNLYCKVPSKTQKYLFNTCLYLAKMSLHDSELTSKLSYQQLTGGIIIVSLKIVEQIDPLIISDSYIPNVCSCIELESDELLDIANKILELAKTFDKKYPSLENLKKFNKFSYDSDSQKN